MAGPPTDPSPPAPGFLDRLAPQIASGGEPAGVWSLLAERTDYGRYRPAPDDAVESHEIRHPGEAGFILKHRKERTYLKLEPEDHYLWTEVDAAKTVKDLVLVYFQKFGTLALERVQRVIGNLKRSRFLKEKPADLYALLGERTGGRRKWRWLERLQELYLEKTFSIRGIDLHLERMYRSFVRYLYARPLVWLYAAVSVVGALLFLRLLSSGEHGVLRAGRSVALGAFALYGVFLVYIVIHEAAHAFTVKHYGREVPRGGMMLYYGSPAFFVDTTDIWLENRWRRIAVSWAGPWSGIILSGFFSIYLAIAPDGPGAPVLFRFCVVSYFMALININPLLELDGYYILIDLLRIPKLRARSFAFWKERLWQNLRGGVLAFTREERIFILYGALAGIWFVVAIVLALFFIHRRLTLGIEEMQHGTWASRIFTLCFLVGVVGMTAVGLLAMFLLAFRRVFALVARSPWWRNDWFVAGTLWTACAAAVVLPVALPLPAGIGAALEIFVGSLATLAVLALGWRGPLRYLEASPLRWAYVALLAATPFLLPGTFRAPLEALGVALGQGTLVPAAALLSSLGLVAFALLYLRTAARRLTRSERVVLDLSTAAMLLLAVFLARGLEADRGLVEVLGGTVGPAFLLAAVVRLAVLCQAFRGSRLTPYLATLTLGVLAILAGELLGARGAGGRALLAGLVLLAAGLYLKHLLLARLALSREAPASAVFQSDREQLAHALEAILSALLERFRLVFGPRLAGLAAERISWRSLESGWGVTISGGTVAGAAPEDESIKAQATRYRKVVQTAIAELERLGGRPLVARMKESVVDGLYWQARETAAAYLFGTDLGAREIESALTVLRGVPLFHVPSDDALRQLAGGMVRRRFQAGEAVFEQGEVGDELYVVLKGNVDVWVRGEDGKERLRVELGPGDFFGELALFRNVARMATCRAATPVEALALSRTDFDRHFEGRGESIRGDLIETIEKMHVIESIPLFAELDNRELARVASRMTRAAFPEGAEILVEGREGKGLFVVAEGRVAVEATRDGRSEQVAELERGEYFGEISLFLDRPCSATVRAMGPLSCLVLAPRDFEELLGSGSALDATKRLETVSSRRLIDLRQKRAASAR